MLDPVDEGANVREKFHCEFVPGFDEFFGILRGADARRGSSEDDGTRR